VVEAAPESPVARSFNEIALRLAGRVSARNVETGGVGLKIDRGGGKNRHLPIAR
jgi:hypothetical protein